MLETNLENTFLKLDVGKLGKDILDTQKLVLDGKRNYSNRLLDVEEDIKVQGLGKANVQSGSKEWEEGFFLVRTLVLFGLFAGATE